MTSFKIYSLLLVKNEADIIREHAERINMDYYRKQCDDAVATINKYYPFDEFVGCDPQGLMFIDESAGEEVPFK